MILAACLCFAACTALRAADSVQSLKSDKTNEEISNLRREKLKVAEERYNVNNAGFLAGTLTIDEI
jgi:hypothetical protein